MAIENPIKLFTLTGNSTLDIAKNNILDLNILGDVTLSADMIRYRSKFTRILRVSGNGVNRLFFEQDNWRLSDGIHNGMQPTTPIDIVITIVNGFLYLTRSSKFISEELFQNQVSPLQAWAKSETEIDLQWMSSFGATTYELQRDTDAGFTSPTILTDSAVTTFSDTGLSSGVTYHYRVKARGAIDSEFVSVTKATLSFQPIFWIELTSASNYTSDDFVVNTVSNEVTEFKPVFGSSETSNLISQVTPLGPYKVQFPYKAHRLARNTSTNFIDLPNDLIFTGDFTICYRVALFTALSATNIYLFSDSGTDLFFLNNTRARATLGGVTTNITYSNSNPPTIDTDKGTLVDIVIKRVGSTVSFSWDGGTNFDSATFNTNTITIDRLFATKSGGSAFQSGIHRIMAIGSEMNSGKLNEFFNYNVPASYVETVEPIGSTIDILGTSYGVFPTNGYFSDIIHKQAIGNWVRSGRCYSFKDKTLLVTSKSVLTPTYVEDTIRVIDHSLSNQVSAPIDLGTYHDVGDIESVKSDVHNLASTFIYDRRIYFVEVYPHYQFINIKRSGFNYDLNTIETVKSFNGLLDKIGFNVQYCGVKILNDNEIYFVFQRNVDGPNEICVYKTTTNFEDNEFWVLAKVGSNDDVWVYPYIIEDNSTTEATIALNIIDKTINPDPAVPAGIFTETCMVKTSDFETLNNKEDTVSNEVKDSITPLTLSTLTTNYSISSDVSEDVTLTNMHYDTTLLEYFGIEGDGAGGWNVIFIVNSTGVKITKAIDVGAVTVVDSRNEDGGYIYKTSADNYDVYLMATVGGKNVPYKFSTNDKGVTWSQDGVPTEVDQTKNHNRIWGTENQHEADNVILQSVRADVGNDGELWIKVLS